MKAVIQRVSRANVDVNDETIGKIGRGFLVLLGVANEDTDEDMDYLVKKITQMRIFEDETGKMNLSLKDVGGEILIISQFTLFASTKKGNRPSFTEAGAPDFSKEMYLKFIAACRDCGIHTVEFCSYRPSGWERMSGNRDSIRNSQRNLSMSQSIWQKFIVRLRKKKIFHFLMRLHMQNQVQPIRNIWTMRIIDCWQRQFIKK